MTTALRGKYHPDPEINDGVIADSLDAEQADLAAGYPPRRWECECGASHGRGHFPFGAIGSHRCLRCGYVGTGGRMFVDDGNQFQDALLSPESVEAAE